MKAKSRPFHPTGWRRPPFAEAAKRLAVGFGIVIAILLLAMYLSASP